MDSWEHTCDQTIKLLAKANTKDKKYLIVANTFIDAINSESISENTPLPAQRKLALKLNLTLATINRVYQYLVSKNQIISQPGKGSVTIKLPLPNTEKSIKVTHDSKQIIQAPSIDESAPFDLRFTQAFNITSTLETTDIEQNQDFQSLLNNFLSRINFPVLERKAFIHQSRYDALELCLTSLLEPKDTLLCLDLTFAGLANICQKHSFNIKSIQSNKTLDLSVIEQYCKIYQPKALCLFSHSSEPWALRLNEQQSKSIALICKRFNVSIIEDASSNWTTSTSENFANFLPEQTYSLISLSNLPVLHSKKCIIQAPEKSAFDLELALCDYFQDHQLSDTKKLINLLNNVPNWQSQILSQTQMVQTKLSDKMIAPFDILCSHGSLWVDCESSEQSKHLKMLLGSKNIISLDEEAFSSLVEPSWNIRIQTQSRFGIRLQFAHLTQTAIDNLCIKLIQCLQLLSANTYKHTNKSAQHHQTQ